MSGIRLNISRALDTGRLTKRGFVKMGLFSPMRAETACLFTKALLDHALNRIFNPNLGPDRRISAACRTADVLPEPRPAGHIP